jgi:hypothetical protein
MRRTTATTKEEAAVFNRCRVFFILFFLTAHTHTQGETMTSRPFPIKSMPTTLSDAPPLPSLNNSSLRSLSVSLALPRRRCLVGAARLLRLDIVSVLF